MSKTPKYSGVVLLFFLFSHAVYGQNIYTPHSQLYSLKVHHNDSVLAIPRDPWAAVTETFALNIGVWTFDRYALKADYAHVSMHSMKRNLGYGFVWDNDKFMTNLFGHPYQGGLYFSAARNNGLAFWESVPYSVGGSLMWEVFLENEPPSINDFISTSIGGVSIGEVTYRLSDLVIDDRKTGWERFGRELLITVISPVRGLNRILSGNAWRYRNFKGRTLGDVSARFYLTGGYRTISDNRELKEDISQGMFVDLRLLYGDPFEKEHKKPYDYFTMGVTTNFFSKQPLISNVNAIGMLWGKNIDLKQQSNELTVGLFQHFDYYDSYAELNNKNYHSFKFSEAAALGAGLLYKSQISSTCSFYSSAHLNAILLGGSLTDYYQAIDRDYNLGSGLSYKISAGISLAQSFELDFGIEDYWLYTWKGYGPKEDLASLSKEEQTLLNVQGDKGYARLSVLKLNANYRFGKYYTASLSVGMNYRKSHYEFLPDVKYSLTESRIGIGYLF